MSVGGKQFRPCRDLFSRLRLFCRPAPSEDTESSTDPDADQDFFTQQDWAWYEQQHQNDYDSLHFPPGLLNQAASCTSEADSSEDMQGNFVRRGHEGQQHCWDDPSSSPVLVRGKTYLEKQLKEPSKSPMLELADVDLFRVPHDIVHYAENPRGRVAHLRAHGDERFLFVLNFRMAPLQLIITWALPEGAEWRKKPAGLLFDNFCKTMSDEARNTHLKLLPKVVEGSWLITKLVPPKPFLLCRQCTAQYFSSESYLEASIDCSTSSLGKKLTAMLTDGSCALELFCILEGKTKEELPERVLGGAAIIKGHSTKIEAFGGL